MKRVNELIAERNRINAQIAWIQSGTASENEAILIEEISNLIDGVGKSFVSGDHYAPERYYSRIQGVKNIRFGGQSSDGLRVFEVKIASPAGALIPEEVVLPDGGSVQIRVVKSSKFESEVDY